MPDRSRRGGTVSLVSRGSLERLREEAGAEAPVDGRRFRMLFEIDGVGAHEEDDWLGREVRVGDAVLRLNGDVGRCVVTSHDPDTRRHRSATRSACSRATAARGGTSRFRSACTARSCRPGASGSATAVAPVA